MGDTLQSIIAVHPASALDARPRLFASLAAALHIAFVPWTPAAAPAAGLIVIANDPASAEIPDPRAPAIVVGATSPPGAEFEDVLLADVGGVDRRVRGVTLRDRLVGEPLSDAETLARTTSTTVWNRSHTGLHPVDRVRCVLPELGDDEVLYTLLSQRAIAMVAVTQFLRSAGAATAWSRPPLRAAFVFDDPNLRWRSYGFINYRELVAHADDHGYHAAMAMIPLDATMPHGPTVRLFAHRPDRLSLVFHGNNHVKGELLRPADDRTALAMIAQAVRRIERLERRHGVRIERVMMPPHGLCSEHTARMLSAVGFDALCAIHPVPWTRERPVAHPLVAWNPAEFVGGCAVIPRAALVSTVADLALRAFLDHPVVIYAHHDDVAHGLEPLAAAAATVNRMGDVRWSSVGEIALTNASHRVSGSRMIVRPYSRRVIADVPGGVDSMVVEEPDVVGDAGELRGWSVGAGEVMAFGEPAEVSPGPHELRLHGDHRVDPELVPAPPWRPWPTLRRAATELRDRTTALAAR